jgi:hypothetical protein
MPKSLFSYVGHRLSIVSLSELKYSTWTFSFSTDDLLASRKGMLLQSACSGAHHCADGPRDTYETTCRLSHDGSRQNRLKSGNICYSKAQLDNFMLVSNTTLAQRPFHDIHKLISLPPVSSLLHHKVDRRSIDVSAKGNMPSGTKVGSISPE